MGTWRHVFRRAKALERAGAEIRIGLSNTLHTFAGPFAADLGANATTLLPAVRPHQANRTGVTMRILIVGAGAVGGYFGGRLLEAGGDVTLGGMSFRSGQGVRACGSRDPDRPVEHVTQRLV